MQEKPATPTEPPHTPVPKSPKNGGEKSSPLPASQTGIQKGPHRAPASRKFPSRLASPKHSRIRSTEQPEVHWSPSMPKPEIRTLQAPTDPPIRPIPPHTTAPRIPPWAQDRFAGVRTQTEGRLKTIEQPALCPRPPCGEPHEKTIPSYRANGEAFGQANAPGRGLQSVFERRNLKADQNTKPAEPGRFCGFALSGRGLVRRPKG